MPLVEDRTVSKGISINPNRCGGKPTVEGTRVTASMLASLMAGDEPMTADSIINEYSFLTYADLSNVKGWVKKGMPR